MLPYRGSGLEDFHELVQRESRYLDTRFLDLSQECGSQWRTGVVRISVSAYRESGIREVSCIDSENTEIPMGSYMATVIW